MLNKLENALIVLGSTIGLANIESVLGIVILILQLCLILYKLFIKVYERIKNKEYNEIIEDTKNTIEELNNLKDKNKEE